MPRRPSSFRDQRSAQLSSPEAIVVLFHMRHCPFCEGLPGHQGPVASAARGCQDFQVEYREVERSTSILQQLPEIGSDTLVKGFPTIAIVTPDGEWYSYTGADRSEEALRGWIQYTLRVARGR